MPAYRVQWEQRAAVTATVTATPTVTTFDPGNGDSLVSCGGPGQAWVDPGDNSAVPTRTPLTKASYTPSAVA